MIPGAVGVGIDLGTTNLKVAAFSCRDGRLLGSVTRALSTRVEADGTREQDVEGVVAALAAAFQELRGRLGAPVWQAVEAVGLAAQGGSGALVRRTDGTPLSPLYLWNDSRAASLLPEVAARQSAAWWQELSQRRGPGAGLARMLWLQQQRPGCLAGDVLYAGIGEIVFHRLAGVWRQDACNALQMGCYRVLEDRLDDVPLGLLGLSLNQVAPLRRGHGTVPLAPGGAALLGLRAGIPAAGPYMDHEAGYSSATTVSQRPLQCSLGTAWVGNFAVPCPQAGGSPVQLVIASPCRAGESLVIQPLLTGNVTWDWALSCFVAADHRAALGQLDTVFAAALLPPAGMVCIPWCTQANPFLPGVRGGGLFAGLSVHAGTWDFVRAAACGLCCEFHRVFAEVADAGLVDCMVLGGGASQGGFFQRLLAGLFAPLAVVTMADADCAGARGALAAFPGILTGGRFAPVEQPDGEAMDRLRGAAAAYRSCFEAVYGRHAAAAPYRLSAA